MFPSSPQLAPKLPEASHNVIGAPPRTQIFFILPSAKNPIHWLSGEKNGPLALSVPGRMVFSAWSSSFVARCILPSEPREEKAIRKPSGEIAVVTPLVVLLVIASGPRSMLSLISRPSITLVLRHGAQSATREKW